MITHLDNLDRISVLVVGDIMLDRYLWGEVRRISPEAPVPVVKVERESHTAGGAANVALNLAALGVRCELAGVVGDDANGEELRHLLARANVAMDSKLRRKGASTITKTRIIAQRQQVCRLDWEGHSSSYSLADEDQLALLAERALYHDAIIISDYAKGVISQPVIDRLRQARATCGVFLALDPKPSRALEINGMDLLTPNRNEAAQLAGLSTTEAESLDFSEIASEVLSRHSPERLVVTLSENGMLLVPKQGPQRHFPTTVLEVADVSGAGDTVIGTLTAAICAGFSDEMAVAIANAAAGVVVGKLGTAMTSRRELLAALNATMKNPNG